MTLPSRRVAVLVALAATASLAACSEPLSSGPPPTTQAPPTTTTIVGAPTPALTLGSTYRAQLTYLMVEQVYLLGRVTQPLATGATPTADATGALDSNSHNISDLLADAQGYGPSFDTAFYSLWTQRISDFEAYATADATSDKTGEATAVASLATNATAIGTLVHGVNRFVEITTVTNPGTGMADEFGPDNTAVETFIDDQASKSTKSSTDLVAAAEAMYHTSDYMAAAAGKLDPVQYPGTIDGTAANLRASITMSLVEHVDLMGMEIDGLIAGNDGEAAAALSTNSQELHDIVAVNFGDGAAQQFDGIWSGYISQMKAYTTAKSSGDSAAAATAAGLLAGVPGAVGGFFHAQTSKLTSDGISADLSPIVSGLQAAADAAVGNTGETAQLRTAATYVPQLGADLSEAIALGNPSQYLP